MEDATESGNELESQHILPAVVADFENCGLPDFGCALTRMRAIFYLLLGSDQSAVAVVFGRIVRFLFTDAESRHVGCFRMGLKRLSRLAVDADDFSVRIAREIDADINLDLAQLLFNLLLLLGLCFLDEWAQFARDASNFVEEGELALVKVAVTVIEAFKQSFFDFIEGWFQRIGLVEEEH